MKVIAKIQNKHFLFKLLKMLLKLVYPRHVIIGKENVLKDLPAVFICNHIGSYAPIVTELFLPFRFRPWVLYNIMSPDLCRDYLEVDFVQKELKLKYPFSRWLAAILAPICLWLMNSVEAIPVYQGKMKIRETFTLSMVVLRQGTNLLIFPENEEKNFSEFINDFHRGFVHLGKIYNLETGKNLPFYPLYVDKIKRTLTIGQPIEFLARGNIPKEKEHVLKYLRDSINEIALAGRNKS